MNLKVYRIDFGSEWEFVIAHNIKDALKVMQECLGCSDEEMAELYGDAEIIALDDNMELSIWDENEREKTTRKCSEWIQEIGRGFLACSY